MILALGHKKFVGKDTISRIILNEFSEYDPRLLSFAYPLKKITYDLFEWCGVERPEYYETLPGDKTKYLPELKKTVRELWIDVGLYGRSLHTDCWARPVVEIAKKTPFAVVTDLRFPNEARLLKEAGAKCIRILRPQIKNTDDAADCALDGFTDWDITFVNNTVSLKSLERKVKKELIPYIKAQM